MSGGATGTSKCCAFLRTWHSPETPGYIYDAAASGAIIVTNFFLIFAVTELATEDAGCDPDSDDVCTEHVHGLRPSNIMPYIATISGLISAVFMPIAGTVIDHTPFQWESGIISALVLTVVTLVQGLIAVPDLWFLIALLQVLSIVSYTVHIVVVTAYQPDFTDGLETEEERQAEFNKINAAGVFATFGTETFLIPFFLAVGAIGGLSTAGVSSFAQIFSGILVAVLFYFAWDARMGTLKKRPQKQQNAEGVNILTCGFKKLTATWKEINETNKGLAGFLIAEAFAEAAFSAFSSIAIIFMAGQLNATITESFAVILIVLVVSLPSAIASAKVMDRLNPLYTTIATMIYMAVCCTLFGLIVRGPDQLFLAYIFGILFGFAFGIYYSAYLSSYMMMIPNGSEVEYMGILQFSRQVITWLPPLAFAGLNRLLNDQSWGLYVLAFFFTMAALVFRGIDFAETKAIVAKLNSERLEGKDFEMAPGKASQPDELRTALGDKSSMSLT